MMTLDRFDQIVIRLKYYDLPPSEADELYREMGTSFAKLIKFYDKHHKKKKNDCWEPGPHSGGGIPLGRIRRNFK